MYVLPRGLESLWSVLRARKWVPFVPGGEIIMTRCAFLSRPWENEADEAHAARAWGW